MSDIKGYRELSETEVGVINSIKDAEILVGELWKALPTAGVDVDMRWASIAKTHLEEGFMAFVRAVAKPEGRF